MNELNDYSHSLDESATDILRVKKEKGDSNAIQGTGSAGAATASSVGEDDVEVVQITDQSSFYYRLYVDTKSGKPVNKPRSWSEKVKKKAVNELTPTPTRAIVSLGKQVVSPPCSASRRCDDGSGCDVDVEDIDIPKIRGTEEEEDKGVITSRNVNLFNRSVDTDGFAAARAHRLQSKLNMTLDEKKNLQHESRQQAEELDRLRAELEDRDKKLELQKQQIDELLQKQAIQESGDDDEGEDGDESVVEITNHQEINRSNERRDKEKRQLLRNIDLNSCVEIRTSQLDGVGIFANREIPKGTQVFKFNCKPTLKTVDCSQEEIGSLLPDAQRMVKKFFLPRNGCYPIPKSGLACVLGLSFLVNSCGVKAKANLKFGDKKDFSGYLEIVAARKIDPDEELCLPYKFDPSRTVPVPDHVVSSSLMPPSDSHHSGSSGQPPLRQSTRDSSPLSRLRKRHRIDYSLPKQRRRKSDPVPVPDHVVSSSLMTPTFDSHHSGSSSGQPPSWQSTRDSSPLNRLRKRHGRIDYSPLKQRKRKKDRKSNCGRFSNREAMFWMEPDEVWVRGRVHGYVTAQERNKECTCRQAACNCPKYSRGKYQYTVEGYIDLDDNEYFSDEDDTVKIWGLSGKALWK